MQTSLMKTELAQKSVLSPSVQAVFDREARRRLEDKVRCLEQENQYLKFRLLGRQKTLESITEEYSAKNKYHTLSYQIVLGGIGLAAYLTWALCSIK